MATLGWIDQAHVKGPTAVARSCSSSAPVRLLSSNTCDSGLLPPRGRDARRRAS
jgi:hypothetical protein